MVAGGVQSVEEGTLYATHPTYYPQFYSTLLPPAPPGSYSSSNYSSSTYSSSGKSSDCSWLRPEGVEGAFVSSPSGRARHPRCTCPSPEAVRQARKALAARRVRASRDPRCTCPSPPGSRDASPWSGTSPSPPSTPATASPPPRHPRCTCPESDSSHRLNSNRRARSARDLRCTCPSTPTPPPSREAECTCPPQLRPHQSQPQQHQPTRRSSKGRLVHAVLLNYPGSTAISTDHGDFVRLSDSPGKITEPDVVLKAKPKKNKAKPKSKGDKSEDEDTVSTDVGEVGCVGGSEDTATPPSSPAQRVKNKLCHLRHKVVSGVAALTISRGQKDHDGRTCSCEGEGHPVRPRVRAPGVVTRILPPPPSPAADESSQDEEKGRVDENISSDQESSFPVEDLPQPILEDVCSPLGSVPPLSPPKIPFTPTIRENFFQHPLTRHLFELGSNANLTSPSTTPTKDTTTISFSRTNELRVVNPNLKQLQKLSISHGQLNGELASVMRTRSMELYVKDMTDQTLKLPRQQRIGGSVCHLAAGAPNIPSHIEPQVVRKILPQSPSRLHSGNDSSQFSTPCLSSGTLTCFSTSQNTLKVSDSGATEKMQSRLRKHPDYENVAFHNSGEYVMLSKKLLDQWQLSYDACLPPEGTLVVTDSEGIATLQNDLPSVSYTESGQVSSITPLKKQDLEKVALPLCPSTSVLLPICPPTSHISFGGQNTSTMLPPSPITTRPVGSLATYTTDVLHSSLPPLPSTSLAYLPPFSTFSSASSPTPPPPPTPPLTTFTSSSSFPLPEPPSTTSLAEIGGHPVGGVTNKEKAYMTSPRRTRDLPIPQPGHFHSLRRDSLKLVKKEDLWMPRSSLQSEARSFRRRRASDTATSTKLRRGSSSSTSQLEQTGEWRRRPLHPHP
ncbi:uncharacterized protein, partial [Palaemon carinicauda]|uniref:uncharacterized protein n=1 Tax=Palaemon carinicauda TaxID=392227 RepID=UPI0035B57DDD